MQSVNYKESLKEALKNLINVNKSIFDSLVPVLMEGELKEWNSSVPIGEIHEFSFELFKNSDDTNIQLLIGIIEKVDETFNTIKNINNIELDE